MGVDRGATDAARMLRPDRTDLRVGQIVYVQRQTDTRTGETTAEAAVILEVRVHDDPNLFHLVNLVSYVVTLVRRENIVLDTDFTAPLRR